MRHLATSRMLIAGMLITSMAACTEPDRQADGDRSDRPSTATYRAIGTEPFWGLHITAEGLRFTTPDDPEGMRFPPAEPARKGDTLHWTSTAAGASLDARIWPAECSDNMSDKVWTHTSVVRFGATTYQGCAELHAPADSAAG